MEKEKEKLIAGLKMEHDALGKRLTSLIKALDSKGFEEKVGETQMELLLDQESAMRLYLRTLAMRIEDLEKASERSAGNGSKPKDDGRKTTEEGKEGKGRDDAPDLAKDILSLLEKCLDKDEEKKDRPREDWLSPWFLGTAYTITC